MTRDQLRLACRRLGISVRERDQEIRINYSGGQESTAYYTTDREDALHTAIAMRHRETERERQLEQRLIESGLAFEWRDGNGVRHVSLSPEAARKPYDELIRNILEEINQ